MDSTLQTLELDYLKANELFEKESQEAEILKAYLPEKLSEGEVVVMIEKIIAKTLGTY